MNVDDLRPSQIRTLYFVAAGFSFLEIALKIGAANSTVKNAIKLLKQQFNLSTRDSFVDFAISNQIITEDKVKRGLEWKLKAITKGLPLTSREIEVVKLIATGFQNIGIAERMGISIKTVEKFRQNAMDKLDCHNVAKICLYAFRNNLVELNEPASCNNSSSQVPITINGTQSITA